MNDTYLFYAINPKVILVDRNFLYDNIITQYKYMTTPTVVIIMLQGHHIPPCSNGQEWYKLRHAVQMMMLRPREVSYYYPLQDKVAEKAVEKLATEMDKDGVVPDLHTLVSQWILECKD